MVQVGERIVEWWPWLLGWVLLSSLIAFVAHGRDKRAARLGRRRTPERTLHLLELIGGWPGALLAMTIFHHKTRKASYFLVTALIVLVWIVVGMLVARSILGSGG
ncbi:MAG: DUF1294 domain-containing protein [Phycisphaeraceae bacterium]|nr:DUF1294 domain-containing protein [Phycisphaeraceae bacterium]MCP4012367.1 DUF1294 domain-containing protein [Phycisphaeraceae bacterium]MCP4068875.1 DUF1294 domain-containing protein [Phycisphaeraceae bacterium]MCP4796191.1 DUF1294 domain-containing protein [Phycisphaeraceae bacterium]